MTDLNVIRYRQKGSFKIAGVYYVSVALNFIAEIVK